MNTHNRRDFLVASASGFADFSSGGLRNTGEVNSGNSAKRPRVAHVVEIMVEQAKSVILFFPMWRRFACRHVGHETGGTRRVSAALFNRSSDFSTGVSVLVSILPLLAKQAQHLAVIRCGLCTR